MLKAGISTQSEEHCSPHSAEAGVGMLCDVGELGELGHHEPSAVAVHAATHCLVLLSLFAMSGLSRTMPPLLAILALDAFPGIVALDTASLANDIPGRAITDSLESPTMVRAITTSAGTSEDPSSAPDPSTHTCGRRR